MIFISYRRSDGKATAQLIQKSLIEKGFARRDIFLDLHDILADDFTLKIHNAIHACDYFILLVTKNSFKKQENHDYYWDEIHQALNEKKKIVPILYETNFDEISIPKEFKQKKLHLKNAIRYDIEYEDASMEKIVSALTRDNRPSVVSRIASIFVIPTVFITIYLSVSILGGMVRYFWDNYWLSDVTCDYIGSTHIQRENENTYYYWTHDSLYVYDKEEKNICVYTNQYAQTNEGLSFMVDKHQVMEAGFWTLTVGMVYEISKFHYKPHGNSKVIGVTIAATVSIIAGFGLGFVCERMIFPVHESRIMRGKLHSPAWWNQMTNPDKHIPSIIKKF